jgi:3-hydroxyisobutyrate dehydrogenase
LNVTARCSRCWPTRSTSATSAATAPGTWPSCWSTCWFGQAIATAESLLLARRSGIDLDVLRHALTDSAASSAFIRDSLGALLAGDYMTGFGLDRCCEELETVTALGREHDVPFELSALVERIHQRALTRYGPADGELLAVALLEERAGIRLRHGPP